MGRRYRGCDPARPISSKAWSRRDRGVHCGAVGIFPFLILAGIVMALIGAWHRRNAYRIAWTAAAEELGIQLEQANFLSSPKMRGSIGGFGVTVETFSGGSNNNTYTRYQVTYPSLNMGLSLRSENPFTKITRFFGVQDVEVGDPRFDDTFQVQADSEEMIRSFLTPRRREALVRLIASYGNVVITDDTIKYEKGKVETDGATIVSTVRRLVSTAQLLTGDQKATPVSDAIRARLHGDLGTAAEEVSAAVEPHPDDVDERILEGETLYLAGRTDDAKAVFEDLSSRLPNDPDVAGWSAEVNRPTPPPRSTERVDTDPVAISSRLFGENRLSFETTRIYEDEFAGRSVRWTGTVRRVTNYEADHDFRNGPITKAVIEIATIENDLYGNARVDAVVAFPPETGQRLAEGRDVTFTGRLVKADGLVRNLFVADGRLVT
jgi:hypothetical protein